MKLAFTGAEIIRDFFDYSPVEERGSQGSRQFLVHWLALILVTVVAYAHTLEYGFVWDDHPLIVENPVMERNFSVTGVFTQDFWVMEGRSDRFRHFYRPIVTAVNWLTVRIAGYKASLFHGMNLLWHCAVVLMAWSLSRRFGLKAAWATLAATVFALHPAHVENVSWISGRTDLLAAMFAFPAILFWLDAVRLHSWKRGWIAAVFYFFALLSKEVAVVAPLALLAFPGVKKEKNTFQKVGIPAMAFFGLYLILRFVALEQVYSNVYFPDAPTFVSAIGHVLAAYLRISVFLYAGDPHYSDLQFDLIRDEILWQGWLWLAALAGALLLIRRVWLQGWRALWWFLIFLLPVMSLGSFGDVLYADRFLYLPSLGFAWLVSLGIERFQRALGYPFRRKEDYSVAVAMVLVVTLYLPVLVRSSMVWKSDVVLFERVVETSDRSGFAWNNLGTAYLMDESYWKAEQAFRRSLELKPGLSVAWHGLGVSLRKQGRMDMAKAAYQKAIDLDPGDFLFYFNFGELQEQLGNYQLAEKYYRSALKQYSGDHRSRHNLGHLLLGLDKLEESERHLSVAAATSRFPSRSLNSLGLLRLKQGRRAEAADYFRKAMDADPGYDSPRENLERLTKEGF